MDFDQQLQLQRNFLQNQRDINAATNQSYYNVANIQANARFDSVLEQIKNNQETNQSSNQNRIDVANIQTQARSSDVLAQLENQTKISTNTNETNIALQGLRNLGNETSTFLSGSFGLANLGLKSASDLVTGGLNYLYANNLIEKQAQVQRENFDYMTGAAETSFKDAGLPSWLAFTGGKGASAFPAQSQALSGSNFFTSSLPGNTSQLAWTGSQSQLALGVGNAPQLQ